MKLLAIPLLATSLAVSFAAEARDQIRAVGSSTVYPFVTVAAEEFGRGTNYNTPIVESTGTGGGFKLFCGGIGEQHPDLSNASRAIKISEVELCAKNGISDIIEINIGYDGIVLANARGATQYELSKQQIFNALAKMVVVDGKLVQNPNKKWSDISADLPATAISVYGPPPTSGTRDAFVELVLEKACVKDATFKSVYPDKKTRKKACHAIREDGAYVESGENDNLIIQKLASNPDALGIFGFSFLDQNGDKVQGSIVEGAEPTFENISTGTYKVSRPLFVYVKQAHVGIIPGLKEFALELVNEDAIGAEGYLTYKGLIPLSEDAYNKLASDVKAKLQ